MSSRARVETNHSASIVNTATHEKLLHGLSLMIFSSNGAEATTALYELLRWSAFKPQEPAQVNSVSNYAQPTPMLVMSLTKFIKNNVRSWAPGPSTKPAITALAIFSNLVNSCDSKQSLVNAIIIASSVETIELLYRISLSPFSPLAKHSQNILLQTSKFCDIEKYLNNEHGKKLLENLCSLFMIMEPYEEETNIVIFIHFALLPSNCKLFLDKLGAENMVTKIAQLLSFPSTNLRDLLLEFIYLCSMSIPDFKDVICSSQTMLRALLTLAIPPFKAYESKYILPFTPCQKACVLLLELSDDSRVISYLARFKLQISEAMLHWKSCDLPKLALKLSNASSN